MLLSAGERPPSRGTAFGCAASASCADLCATEEGPASLTELKIDTESFGKSERLLLAGIEWVALIDSWVVLAAIGTRNGDGGDLVICDVVSWFGRVVTAN